MTRIVASVVALLVLASCGADGEPIPPTQNAVSWLSSFPVQVMPLDK